MAPIRSSSNVFKANDGKLDSNLATVSIYLAPVSHRPVAVPDSLQTAEDTPLFVPASQLLDNDVDVDGKALSIVIKTQPQNGEVQLDANGNLTWTPNRNFNGTDSLAPTLWHRLFHLCRFGRHLGIGARRCIAVSHARQPCARARIGGIQHL